MADNVFPEDQGTGGYPDTDVSRGSDFNDAAHFAAHAYAGRPYSALIDGGQISYPDTTTTDISISNGMAAIVASNVTGDQSDYTHDSGTFIVDFDSRVVTLNSGVSEIYLTIDLDNNDSVAIDARTDGTTPSLPSLKIGVVDTADATVRDQWYLLRDDGTLSFPDSAAVGTALNTLDTLSTVYNRSAGKRVIDSSLSIDDLDTTSLTNQITDTQLDTSSGFFDLGSNDLRLATGQGIEDGSGSPRFDINSVNTIIQNDEANQIIKGRGGKDTLYYALNDEPIKLFDREGGFDAVTYNTSASAPGTLELTNADLSIGKVDFKIRNNQTSVIERDGDNLLLDFETSDNATGPRTVFKQTLSVRKGDKIDIGRTSGGNQGSASDPILQLGGGAGFYKSGGDIVAVDDNGNTTTIT